MTTLLDHLDTRPIPAATDITTITPAQRLRTTMAAVRVSFTWFGVQKTLTPEQKAQAAEAFDAEGQFLSAGKKLLDTRHPAFRAVTAVRGKIDAYWKGLSLPFPEPGVRLIKQDSVEEFAAPDGRLPRRARRRRRQPRPPLRRAEAGRPRAARLALSTRRTTPRRSSASSASPGTSPASSRPTTWCALSPGLYEQERARVAARFEEAVQLAEQAFLDEFARLVGPPDRADHRRRRGRPAQGLPRLGRRQPPASSSTGSGRSTSGRNDQLDALVGRGPAGGPRASAPRTSATAAASARRVAGQLSRVQSSLDALLVERPRRRILRQAAGPGGA